MSSEDLWPWRSGDRPGLTSAFALALTARFDADLIESRRSCLLRLRDRSTKRVSASGRADLSDRCRELCRRDLSRLLCLGANRAAFSGKGLFCLGLSRLFDVGRLLLDLDLRKPDLEVGSSSIPFVVHTVNRCRHESLRNPHRLLYLVVTRYWAHSGKKVRSLRTKFPSAGGIGKVAGGSGSGCCSDIFHSEELLWTN